MPRTKHLSAHALLAILIAGIAGQTTAQSFGGTKPAPASASVADVARASAPVLAPFPPVAPAPAVASAASNATPRASHAAPTPRVARKAAASSPTQVAVPAPLSVPVSQSSIAYLTAASDYLRVHTPAPAASVTK